MFNVVIELYHISESKATIIYENITKKGGDKTTDRHIAECVVLES